MTATDNLDNLLASLTWEEWFDYLPVIADAYGEADEWEAFEACMWLLQNGKRPHKGAGLIYAWWPQMGRQAERELAISYVQEMDKGNGRENNSRFLGWTPTIQPQLTAFVEVWKRGVRP